MKKNNPRLHDAYYGIVPSRRGYSVRVEATVAAEMLKVVNPARVRVLGPALEIRATTHWRVDNLPGYVREKDINAAIATPTDDGWPGWPVVAIRRLTPPSQR